MIATVGVDVVTDYHQVYLITDILHTQVSRAACKPFVNEILFSNIFFQARYAHQIVSISMITPCFTHETKSYLYYIRLIE